MAETPDRAKTIGGTAIILGMATGIAGLALGCLAYAGGKSEGAGLCLIAAAFAFGLIANAVFRR